MLRVGAAALAAILAGLPYAAIAKGNMARKCVELPELVLGTDEAGYKVSQSAYELETGKCYKLEIKSSGRKEYALRGADFFRNIWVRKLEAGGMEIKATNLYELEYEDEAESELYFVPISTGSFTLAAMGLEDKGTVVTFNVK